MKFCTKCGNTLPDEAVFCGKCGAKYTDASAPVNKAPEKPANNVMALIGFILGCAGLLFLTLSFVDVFFAIFGVAQGAAALVLSIISKKNSIDIKNKLGFIFGIVGAAGSFIACMAYFMSGAL